MMDQQNESRRYIIASVKDPTKELVQKKRLIYCCEASPSSTNSSDSSLLLSDPMKSSGTEGDCSEELMDMLQVELGQGQDNRAGESQILNLTRSLQQQTEQYKQDNNQMFKDARNMEFTFRSIKVTDRDRVKELHEEWFPVRYQDEFYDDLAENHLAGNPLFTLLATHKRRRPSQQRVDDVEGGASDQNRNSDLSASAQSAKVKRTWTQRWLLRKEHEQMEWERPLKETTINNYSLDTMNNNTVDRVLADDVEDGETCNATQDNPSFCVPIQSTDCRGSPQVVDDDVIAGCVVASFMPITRLSPAMQDLLVSDRLEYRRLFYIMTLGTVSSYRGAGLGTKLVEQCIAKVEEDRTCGTLYLHVLTENIPAINVYERLGFHRVQEIPDYYDIDGVKHPCFLYAKYFHGNRGHLHIYKVLSRAVWGFCKKVWRLANEPSRFPVPSLPTAMFSSNLLSPASAASYALASERHGVKESRCEQQSRISIEYGVATADESDPGL